jgi:hypothetical protein
MFHNSLADISERRSAQKTALGSSWAVLTKEPDARYGAKRVPRWEGSRLEATTITEMADLVAVIRARALELNITHETIDAISGLQSGYFSKIAAGMKGIGSITWACLLPALGLKVVVHEDLEALARVKDRLTPRVFPRRAEHWRDRVKQPPLRLAPAAWGLLVGQGAEGLKIDRQRKRQPKPTGPAFDRAVDDDLIACAADTRFGELLPQHKHRVFPVRWRKTAEGRVVAAA